jgi:hypothetical protein
MSEALTLKFVGAEETADWTEGCQVVLASRLPCGTVRHVMCPHWLPIYAASGYAGFLRLPDALPEQVHPSAETGT